MSDRKGLQVTHKHENSVAVSFKDQLAVSVHLDDDGKVQVYVRDQLREVELVRASEVPRDRAARKVADALNDWLNEQHEK